MEPDFPYARPEQPQMAETPAKRSIHKHFPYIRTGGVGDTRHGDLKNLKKLSSRRIYKKILTSPRASPDNLPNIPLYMARRNMLLYIDLRRCGPE